MRNLKKVLALVMALVMSLSLVTIANAADFSDSADIDYGEAVDVMSAIGVIEGMGNNSFDPDGTLTREQAAKLITYMLLGENADKLGTEGSSFKDVAATRWSAPAIEYCVSMGIIDGAGDGNFYPAGKLTGYAFAKMLLTAIGYDSQIEKYVGSSWTINVASRAIDVGLQKGLDKMFGSAEISRQEAAQMAFNAVKTPLVEYNDKGGSISVDGTLIEFGAQKATYVVVEKADGSTSSDNIDSAETANGHDLIEFGERYYPDLIKEGDSNRLEQPAHKWTYKDKDIGTYADDEDKMVVVDAKDKTLEDIIYGKSYMNYSTSKVTAANLNPSAGVQIFVNGDAETWNTNVVTTLSGVALNKGDTVYTYTNSKGEITTIVVARYMLAKIDEISEKVSTAEKENGAEYRIKLVDLDGNTLHSAYYDDHNTANRVLKGFNAKDYTEGTILAVAFDSANTGSRIQDSYVAEIVTGKPTAAKEAGDGHITVDGKKYQFVTDAGNSVLIDGVYQKFDFDSTYNVYLTKGGYVIGIEGTEAVKIDDIFYVTSVYTDYVGGESQFFAQRVSLVDGKVDTVQIEKGSVEILDNSLTTTPDTDIDDSASKAFAGLYTFNDRKYDAVSVGASTDTSAKQNSNNDILTMIPFSKSTLDKTAQQDLYGSAYAEEDFAAFTGTLDAKIEKADTKMSVSGTKYYMNADTQYVAVEGVGSGIDVTVATGGMNVGDTTASAIVLTEADDTKTVLAFIIADDTNLTGISAASKEVVYLPENTTTRYGNDNYTNDLWFMKDGNLIEDAVITSKENQGFYTYSEKDGAYKLESTAENIKAIANGGNYTYDDEAGYGENLVITTAYDKKNVSYAEINSTTSAQNGNTLTFGAVKLNGTTVTDLRSSSTIDGDVHNIVIDSVSELKAATKVATITADVYFDEGVTFIAVKSLTAKPKTFDATATVDDIATALADDDVVITDDWTLDDALTVADHNLTVQGTLTTDGHNLTVNGVTLTVEDNITATADTIEVKGNGTLDATGKNVTATTITLTSGELKAEDVTGDVTAAAAGKLTATGDVTGNVEVSSLNNTAASVTGNVETKTGGGLTVTGAIDGDIKTAAATTVSAGSVDITDTFDNSGTIKLTDAATGVSIDASKELAGTWEIAGDVTVATSQTLTVSGNVTLKKGLTLTGDATVGEHGTLDLKAAQEAAVLEKITGATADATLKVVTSSDATTNTAATAAKFFSDPGTLKDGGTSGTAATPALTTSAGGATADCIPAGTYVWTAGINNGATAADEQTGATLWLVSGS